MQLSISLVNIPIIQGTVLYPQIQDVTGNMLQTLTLRVPSIGGLMGGNRSQLQATGSLGNRPKADMAITLLRTVRIFICKHIHSEACVLYVHIARVNVSFVHRLYVAI